MSIIEQQTQVPAGTWQLDPVHSSAGFAVKHIVSTFRGGFRDLARAEVRADENGAVIEGAVATNSIEVKDENLKAHLLSPEFFDSANSPEIAFRSTGVRPDGETLAIDGELTIKGNTRPVTVTGTVEGPAVGLSGSDQIGLDLETVINRHDFGLSWNAPLPGGRKVLEDDVTLSVHLELVRAEA